MHDPLLSIVLPGPFEIVLLLAALAVIAAIVFVFLRLVIRKLVRDTSEIARNTRPPGRES